MYICLIYVYVLFCIHYMTVLLNTIMTGLTSQVTLGQNKTLLEPLLTPTIHVIMFHYFTQKPCQNSRAEIIT